MKQQRVIVKKAMQNIVKEAITIHKHTRWENERIWKWNRTFIPQAYMNDYMYEWRGLMRREKSSVERAHERKYEWLKRKWSQKPSIPDVYRGVIIGDQELNEIEFSSQPRTYGGVKLDEDETSAMSLPPGYGFFNRIYKEKCRIDIEMGLNKLRWNKCFQKIERGWVGHNNDDEGEEGRDEHENGDIRIGEQAREKFVDERSKTIDINRLRATDLPYNHQVAVPPSLGKAEETVEIFKNEVMTEIGKLEDKSKGWNKMNTTESVRKGIKKIRDRIDRGEIVCYETDKSGRWSVDSVENYRKACEEHLTEEKVEQIDDEEHESAEREMNLQAAALTYMMGLDEEKGDDRLLNILRAEHVIVPPFYGMRKDHKPVEEDRREEGPKVRPVCDKESVTCAVRDNKTTSRR